MATAPGAAARRGPTLPDDAAQAAPVGAGPAPAVVPAPSAVPDSSALPAPSALTPRPTLDLLVERALTRQPRLGATRLVSIDGPAGSGKSTLAADLAGALREGGRAVTVIGMDDLFAGWVGLDAGIEQLVSGVLAPLARGEAGSYRRWDWRADDWAGTVVVPPTGVLVVEGCGSAPRAAGAWTNLLVFVETDRDHRLARGIARDGEAMRADWLRWMTLEERVHLREGTRARADVLLDGEGNVLR